MHKQSALSACCKCRVSSSDSESDSSDSSLSDEAPLGADEEVDHMLQMIKSPKRIAGLTPSARLLRSMRSKRARADDPDVDCALYEKQVSVAAHVHYELRHNADESDSSRHSIGIA